MSQPGRPAPTIGSSGRAASGARARSRVATVQLVTFAVGEDLFAADVSSVERVLKLREASPVPNMPGWLLGMMAYRGGAVPLLDLRRRFELPEAGEAASDSRRIVVFVSPDGFTAAIVDSVLDVRGVDPAELEPPPPLVRGLAREYVRAVFRREGRLAILLDAARLLSSTERLALDRAG